MALAASTMSSMRMRQSLGGTDRLLENSLPELGLQGTGRDEVHSSAQELLEEPAQAYELEETYRDAELDEEIHVTFGARFATCNGPEYRQGLDVEPVQ